MITISNTIPLDSEIAQESKVLKTIYDKLKWGIYDLTNMYPVSEGKKASMQIIQNIERDIRQELHAALNFNHIESIFIENEELKIPILIEKCLVKWDGINSPDQNYILQVHLFSMPVFWIDTIGNSILVSDMKPNNNEAVNTMLVPINEYSSISRIILKNT